MSSENEKQELDFPEIDTNTDISPRMKEFMSSMVMTLQSEQRIISSSDKVAEKLTEEHIAQIIMNSEKEDSRQFLAFKLNKFISLIIFIVSLVFAMVLLVIFRDSEYFITLVAAIFSFLGGLGIGKFALTKRE